MEWLWGALIAIWFVFLTFAWLRAYRQARRSGRNRWARVVAFSPALGMIAWYIRYGWSGTRG